MDPFVVVIVVVGIAIVVRLLAGGMDRDRIEEYVASHGGKLLEKHWNPFGKGWFAQKGSRIYEIKYLDKEGNLHQATCKTSLFSGVYFTEDSIIQYSQKNDDNNRAERLQEKNQRLREEIEKLRKQDQNID
jgi:hypothetical protein